MANDIALSNVKQVVTDRIKAQFAELIPEDAWTAIVNQATAEFLKTDLPKLVKDDLTARMKPHIQSAFAPDWDANTGRQIASEAVALAMKEHSHEIVNALVGQLVQSIVEQARYRM